MMDVARNSWFVDYQAIPSKGITSGRDPRERTKHFLPDDFKSATVLDVGCNLGSLSFASIEMGARSVIGVDFDRDVIAKARQLLTTENISFSVEDITLPSCWRSLPRCDTVLFCSIYLTREIKNREAVLANACAKAKRTLYFEGHANETQGYRVCDYVRDIVAFSDFENIEHLGYSEGPGFRPLIRCSRGAFGMIDARKKLWDAVQKYDKIVVVGKSASGKTTLCDNISRHLTNVGPLQIYDDIAPPYNAEKFILFDWRGLEYVPDADCVFFVICDESERQKRIDAVPVKDRLLRTSPGVPTNARAIYTVRL